IKSGHGFVVGDEGYRQDSDIQKVKLSREALTQLSKLVESRVSIGSCGWQHLGPFINLRAFYLCGISLAATLAFWVKLRVLIFMRTASAIMNVKSNYGIKRNWQGDPCIPLSYMWDGVNCSYAGSSSPRIIYL
ncbi:hypothetical protein HN873_055750, partial [Arachis hypogaea]